jgi:hypothetical protein
MQKIIQTNRLFSVVLCLLVTVVATAQTSRPSRTPTQGRTTNPVAQPAPVSEPVEDPVLSPLTDSTKAIIDTLKAMRQRIERLQTVLDKVTFGPQSYYFTRLRSWVIPLSDALNDSISQYFFEVTDNDSSFTDARGDIQVIATPEPSRDLVAVFFTGNSKEKKGQRLRELLLKKPERNMYRQILESREYSEDKELIDRKFRIADLTAPKLIKDPDSVLVSFDRYSMTSVDHRYASVVTLRFPDNARIRFGKMWGLEVKLGNEEFGLPFWTSGNLSVLALYNQIKVGAQLPFKWGAEQDNPLSTVWKPRALNGTYGVTAEFDWAFAGGAFLIGFPRNDADGTFADTNNIYYIKAAAQIWYSFTVAINNNANLIRWKAGFGIEQIGNDRLSRATAPGQDDVIIPNQPARFFWSPYIKVDYMNQQFARRFGASLQYFRDWGLGSIWMEILPEQLRVEAKFATAVTRLRDPWEPPYFFTVSIPYTFSF